MNNGGQKPRHMSTTYVVNHAVVGSGPKAVIPVQLRRMVNKQNNFVMVAKNPSHEVQQEGLLIPPTQERTAARSLLAWWHILIKELSSSISEEQHDPVDKINTFGYIVYETLRNILQDFKKRGGEQQALARLAFTIYCRKAIEDTQEANAVM